MKKTLEKQLNWYWDRKARIQKEKFLENLKPKALPYDRITVKILRMFLDQEGREIIKPLGGGRKLKNLQLRKEYMYIIYRDLNNNIDSMREGKKEYVY
jgi:hypothetical protein